MKRLDQHLGLLCMTYLDFTAFRHQISKVTEGSNTPINPFQLGITPIYCSRNDTGPMALKLLSHRRQLQHLSARELERKYQKLLDGLEPSSLELDLQKRNFRFLDYASAHWIYHVTDLDPELDHEMWRLFCRCVDGSSLLAHGPWESTQQTCGESNHIPKAVQWLLAHGHFTLILYHAKHQSHVLTEKIKREILHNSRIHDRDRFTELIVQQGNNSRKTTDYGLFFDSREGRITSLEALLRAGANVNARVDDQTALQEAVEGAHLEVVERLLAAKADVNPASVHGCTALQAAAEGGRLEVVERLRQAGGVYVTSLCSLASPSFLPGHTYS